MLGDGVVDLVHVLRLDRWRHEHVLGDGRRDLDHLGLLLRALQRLAGGPLAAALLRAARAVGGLLGRLLLRLLAGLLARGRRGGLAAHGGVRRRRAVNRRRRRAVRGRRLQRGAGRSRHGAQRAARARRQRLPIAGYLVSLGR